jgi:hypothetical protein
MKDGGAITHEKEVHTMPTPAQNEKIASATARVVAALGAIHHLNVEVTARLEPLNAEATAAVAALDDALTSCGLPQIAFHLLVD